MANWMGSGIDDYEDITLPFADADSIPTWAQGAAKAMYGMGIIQGVGVDGKLYFKPTSPSAEKRS
jgi:hypothetical protein